MSSNAVNRMLGTIFSERFYTHTPYCLHCPEHLSCDVTGEGPENRSEFIAGLRALGWSKTKDGWVCPKHRKPAS